MAHQVGLQVKVNVIFSFPAGKMMICNLNIQVIVLLYVVQLASER
jgi:hypothetical protein